MIYGHRFCFKSKRLIRHKLSFATNILEPGMLSVCKRIMEETAELSGGGGGALVENISVGEEGGGGGPDK